jgi:hypothetical protein
MLEIWHTSCPVITFLICSVSFPQKNWKVEMWHILLFLISKVTASWSVVIVSVWSLRLSFEFGIDFVDHYCNFSRDIVIHAVSKVHVKKMSDGLPCLLLVVVSLGKTSRSGVHGACPYCNSSMLRRVRHCLLVECLNIIIAGRVTTMQYLRVS